MVSRGDITLWFCDEVIGAWEHQNAEKRSGHPFVYSDLAIETLLTLRERFRLPYRQTEGFGRALAKLMNADVPIPDYTSLQKRAAKLGVSINVETLAGPVDVVVDSTGLKVFGDGEWKVKKHVVGKRRTWRKLHLAVDPLTHLILVESLTQSGATDTSQVKPLIEQVEQVVETFYGDGAYDGWAVRDYLQGERIHQIIPPRKGAVIKQHGNSKTEPLERDECVRQIRRDARKRGRRESAITAGAWARPR